MISGHYAINKHQSSSSWSVYRINRCPAPAEYQHSIVITITFSAIELLAFLRNAPVRDNEALHFRADSANIGLQSSRRPNASGALILDVKEALTADKAIEPRGSPQALLPTYGVKTLAERILQKNTFVEIEMLQKYSSLVDKEPAPRPENF